MALVTVSGYPCSGKSKRAEQLKAHLEARFQDPNYAGPRLKVVILSDETLSISRDAYSSESPAPTLHLSHLMPCVQMDVLKSQPEEHCSLQCRDRWDKTPCSLWTL